MFKKGSSIRPALIMLLALMMTACGAIGTAQAYEVKQVWARVAGVAGETLSIGQVVCIKDADGLVYKADADAAALRPALGIIGKGGATGTGVEIITNGILTGWTTLSEGAYGYLSETAGAITQSGPSYAQPVGFAISTTDYKVDFSNYFDSSTLTSLGVLTGTTPIILEGATADAFETTLMAIDPTADNTLSLPNKSGTLATIVPTYTLDTNNVVLTAADCGQVHAIATDAKTYTLPSTVGIAGCAFTIVNAGANGAAIVEIVPAAGDKIWGETRIANGTRLAIAGADAEHFLNTKATALRGDYVVLVADGVDGYGIQGSAGIWAEATP